MQESKEDNTPYTKRELDHYFQEVFSRLDKQDLVLAGIKDQTTKTNGRVNGHDFWLSALKWVCGALWTLLLVLVPVLWHLQRLQSVEDAQSAVKSALSDYVLTSK